MKIGILTFHWATNYGAVLQAYALQTYLESQGHNVEIINYKPKQYNDTIWQFIRNRKFLNIKGYRNAKKQEAALVQFREEYLHQTKRFYTALELGNACKKYNLIISGSDQVMNPTFLMNGEYGTSPAYFLGFPFAGKKIGYAVSFGCTKYPEPALTEAKKYINQFYAISTRESSGLEILKQMGCLTPELVPDPTILLTSENYKTLSRQTTGVSYSFMFFIRNVESNIKGVKNVLQDDTFIINSEDGMLSLCDWLSKIRNAKYVITDSFHCVVMCLFFNVPFIVLTKERGNVGMNDRLYTLLGNCSLVEYIVAMNEYNKIPAILSKPINWAFTNDALNSYGFKGRYFLTL